MFLFVVWSKRSSSRTPGHFFFIILSFTSTSYSTRFQPFLCEKCSPKQGIKSSRTSYIPPIFRFGYNLGNRQSIAYALRSPFSSRKATYAGILSVIYCNSFLGLCGIGSFGDDGLMPTILCSSSISLWYLCKLMLSCFCIRTSLLPFNALKFRFVISRSIMQLPTAPVLLNKSTTNSKSFIKKILCFITTMHEKISFVKALFSADFAVDTLWYTTIHLDKKNKKFLDIDLSVNRLAHYNLYQQMNVIFQQIFNCEPVYTTFFFFTIINFFIFIIIFFYTTFLYLYR